MFDWQGRRVLVTGGAGFIGSHLVDRLVELGTDVKVIDNLSTGRATTFVNRVRFTVADIRSLDSCVAACEDIDTVFHQAALAHVPRSLERPAECIDVNVRGTANLFEAARDAKVRRVVYASSSAVYRGIPHGNGVLMEGGTYEDEATTPYALSKQVNEQLAGLFARCYDMSFVGLRYFNVYGPRQRLESGAVVPALIDAGESSGRFTINGSGEQVRDYVHVSDVVEANLLAASAPSIAHGEAYALNVGTGRGVTLNYLAGLCVGPPRHGPAREHDADRSVASTSCALAEIGFTSKITLEEGLALTMAAL